jgi:hypothetical protein
MKTTKQRLMELAAINNPFRMNEAVDPNAMIKLEVSVKAGTLIEMFGGAETLADTLNDPNKFKQFTMTIAEDLGEWLAGPGGDEWANDGVESGNYDDYIPF